MPHITTRVKRNILRHRIDYVERSGEDLPGELTALLAALSEEEEMQEEIRQERLRHRGTLNPAPHQGG
jgi:flagellar biosynthesis/type III secretory pathway ATPase